MIWDQPLDISGAWRQGSATVMPDSFFVVFEAYFSLYFPDTFIAIDDFSLKSGACELPGNFYGTLPKEIKFRINI